MMRIRAVRQILDGEGGMPCLFLLSCALASVLAACGEAEKPPMPTKSSAQSALVQLPTTEVQKFVDIHWERPIAPQGKPPARFSPVEAALDPDSCGTCHAAQFNDWRGSLHARAMGPGVLGQLGDMKAGARDEHQECLRCHAPLAEQADSLVAALASGGAFADAPQGAPQPLHRHGVMCAACHVRGHQRYGPPRRDGSEAGDPATLPHGGWVSSGAFADSRFCAACHQFPTDGYALNCKLLENTYEEWKASRYAREGRTCQSCHMPDRRHLWRGIHDRETVQAGVTIDVTAPRIQSGVLSATLTIKNTGTGHHFPTYVTPRVVAEVYQEGADRKMLKGTLREYFIGRQVSPDLSKEIADTRIAPDEQASLDYQVPPHRNAAALVFRVRIEPDAFYTGFYRDLLAGGRAGKGEQLIRQALKESTASAFTLYLNRQPLPEPAAR